MKKKLVISFATIISFIFLLSGMLIVNNKNIRNTSVDKEIKSDNKEDTTWQDDYAYKLDKKNKYIVLSLYRGEDKDVVVPATAVVDGVEYKTMPLGAKTKPLFSSVDSIEYEDGVVFPTHLFYIFGSNTIKKIKIGNVDVHLLDSLKTLDVISATEEIDLSDFNNTSMERLSDYLLGPSSMKAPKINLGKNVILKKEFNGQITRLMPVSTTGFWLREGTDEVYSSEDLVEHYNGNTMSGSYTNYDGAMVIYNSNGGAGYIQSKKVNGSISLSNNLFTRYGYNFTGWNTESDGSGTAYSEGQTINVTEKTILYAQWEKENNNDPTMKELNIKFHMNEEDANDYQEDRFYVWLKLDVKIDNKVYTDDVSLTDYQEEKIVKNKGGSYYFSVPRHKDDTENKGVTIKLPEGAKYEVSVSNDTLSVGTETISEDFSGTLSSNSVHDIEVSVPKTDAIIYYLVSDPYKYGEYEFKLSTFNNNIKDNKKIYINYDGTISGTIEVANNFFPEPINFKFKDGDMITLHDIPVHLYVGNNGTTYEANNIMYYPVLTDYSGYFGLSNPMNYTVGHVYKDIGLIKIEKNASNTVGIEDKKFKFKITAKYKDTNNPLTGEYPYRIYSLETEELNPEKYTITFDENGVAYVELKLKERAIIGAAPFGYFNNYTSAVGPNTSYYLYEDEGIIPNEVTFTVDEIEDFNKYEEPHLYPGYDWTLGNVFKVNNKRNLCNLNFSKNYEINLDEITYASIENKISENVRNGFERSAFNFKITRVADKNKYLTDIIYPDVLDEIYKTKLQAVIDDLSEIDYKEVKEIVQSNTLNDKYQKLYEDYLSQNTNLSALEYWSNLLGDLDEEEFNTKIDNLKENYKMNYIMGYINTNKLTDVIKIDSLYEILEEYFDTVIKTNKQALLYFLSNNVPNVYQFKIKFKDNADLSNNGFKYNNSQINLDENNSFVFSAPVNFVINGEKISNQSIMLSNLWCGMEYEIEEIDGELYEHTDVKTSGTLLKVADEDNTTISSITNKGLKKGSLNLTKKIKGNIKESEEFTFNIELELEEGEQTTYKYTGSKTGYIKFIDGKASITLKGGESITISNIPIGTKYKIVEETSGTKVTKENDTGIIEENTKVLFTNSKFIIDVPKTLDSIFKFIIVGIISCITIIFSTKIYRKINKA